MSGNEASEILNELRELKQDVVEIKIEVKATNGRVTKLEGVTQTLLLWQARVQGHAEALSFRSPLLVAVIAAVVGAVASYVASH